MVDTKEQKDLFGTLNSLWTEFSMKKENQKKAYEKMKAELVEAENLIRQRYQDKIHLPENETLGLLNELEHHMKLLRSYSTFEAEMIGNVIEKLVSVIEGEDYSYQKAIHNTYKFETTVYGSDRFRANMKILMIVKDNRNQGAYFDSDEQTDEVRNLVENGCAFVLDRSTNGYYNKTISFYDSTEQGLKCLIDFNKFSYVQDFIDLVIQYRFENHLDEISEKELLRLMSKFILNNKEKIEDNYKERALEAQKRLEQNFIEEQLNLEEEQERKELETLLQNGVPKRYDNNLITRLQEIASNSTDFSESISSFDISYEGEKQKARITRGEAVISSENIFISRISFSSFIKDYFDSSDPDPHFHGFSDINLVDDGLAGIVDISSLNSTSEDVVHSLLQQELYRFDIIDDKYLRVLYLPSKGEYRHKPVSAYGWIAGTLSDESHRSTNENTASYRTDWNISEEAERMLTCLKEIEVLSNLNEKQLKLYKQRKNKN